MITLNQHDITAAINDRYANIGYCFYFENKNTNGSNELRFEITINPTAFISSFQANIDNVVFVGQTKEKEIAASEYKDAKEHNLNTILISQPYKEIPNVFEIKTNMKSKSKVILTIKIEQYLQKQFDFVRLGVEILRNFAKYNICTDNLHYISFKLDIKDNNGMCAVNIPTVNNNNMIIDKHMTDKMGKQHYICGKIMSKSSLNELIVEYKIKELQINSSNIIFDANTNTFCHTICASNIATNLRYDIRRRVIFLIDRSGSMNGQKWNKTISATICALKLLRKKYDRFSIILFDKNIEILPYKDKRSNQCILATDESIYDCINILQNKQVNSDTNIQRGLLKGIELIKSDILFNQSKYFHNQLILITDGLATSGVTNTKQILINIQKANDLSKIDKYNNKICIYTFGVGNNNNDSQWVYDLNHSFLKLLAINNDGFYQRIKQKTADLTLSNYFKMLSKPLLTNINIQYYDKHITQLTNTKFNILYDGNDLLICGQINIKYPINNNDYYLHFKISAIIGNERKPIQISEKLKLNIVSMNNNNIQNSIERRIWAYLHLKQYAKRKLIFNDMIEMDNNEKKQNESLPLNLALKYQFITPWTSMIVVCKNNENNIITKYISTRKPQIQKNNRRIGVQEQKQQQPQNKKKNKQPRYSAERVIGSGSFGVVYKALHLATKQIMAIKKVQQDNRYKNRELQIMKTLSHPNIVKLLDQFYSKIQHKIYLNLVMEFIPETLYVTIRNHSKAGECIPFSLIKVYSYQMCRALHYLHTQNICHRDIKPQNILLDPETHIIKLCDFGSAKKLEINKPNISYISSRYYRAPELIFESRYYNTNIDLWSIGCVIAELFLGIPLFQGDKSVDQLVEIIKVLGTPSREQIMAMNNQYSQTQFPIVKPLAWNIVFNGVIFENKHVENYAIDIISKILIFNPNKRLNGFNCLIHEYFDELKELNYILPCGKKLPPLFNFTDDEIKYAKLKGLQHKLIPKYLWNKYNIINN